MGSNGESLKSCGVCRHFLYLSALLGAAKYAGECFRFPPTAAGFVSPGGQARVTSVRPPVLESTPACGEYAPKAQAVV